MGGPSSRSDGVRGFSTLDYAYHHSPITLRQTAAGAALRRASSEKMHSHQARFLLSGVSKAGGIIPKWSEGNRIVIEGVSQSENGYGCVHSNLTLGFLRIRKELFSRALSDGRGTHRVDHMFTWKSCHNRERGYQVVWHFACTSLSGADLGTVHEPEDKRTNADITGIKELTTSKRLQKGD